MTKTLFITIILLISLIVPSILIVKDIRLTQNCTGYLKRAADANAVDMALTELTRAIEYMEDNELTEGYTSIIWRTPDEDIGFWYKNIKSTQLDLLEIDSTTTKLEKSNVLMKLRETLLDDDATGTKLTFPVGLSKYPGNTMWAILLTISCISVFGCVIAYFSRL